MIGLRPSMDSPKFIQELIRLLLYVAWADDDIAPEEYDYLLRLARNAALREQDIRSLDIALRDRTCLHSPDFDYLKPHRTEVLEHVQSLIDADNHVAPAETDILYKIASRLS